VIDIVNDSLLIIHKLAKFLQKEIFIFKNQKTKKRNDFGGFQSSKVRKRNQ
jgi:hypothetical protein